MFGFLKKLMRPSRDLISGYITGTQVVEDPVVQKYKKTGSWLGEVLNERYVGREVSYESTLDRLIQLEQRIVALGYRPVPIGVFAKFAIKDINVPVLNQDEKPILFAAIWKGIHNENDIFGNENLFQNRRQDGGGVHMEINPKSERIFDHETEFLRLQSI